MATNVLRIFLLVAQLSVAAAARVGGADSLLASLAHLEQPLGHTAIKANGGDYGVWVVVPLIVILYVTYIVLAVNKPSAPEKGAAEAGADASAADARPATAEEAGANAPAADDRPATSGPPEAAPAQRQGMRHSIIRDMGDSTPGTLDEGAVPVKVTGSAPVGLFGDTYSRSPANGSKRKTVIFSAEVEGHLEQREPARMNFLQSSNGVVYQGLLLFVYIHFDAGLPILQDLYKVNFGGTGEELLYNKQSLLITQNLCEIACLYALCVLLRGSIWDCINPMKSLMFAPAGACFGIQAVFGFLAMSEMTSDCYALYSQSSIIVLTIAWTLFFRQALSGSAWCGIILIATGMVGFNLSDDVSTQLGLVYIALKIVTQSFACLYAEKFIKHDPEALYIQMAWIKPVELLFTIIMMFVIPPKAGHLPPHREILQQGLYHDWNYLTVVIMLFNMGDTLMTATIAKKFDSVVKGVAGVFDIIYPTQVAIRFIKPPHYTALEYISAVVIFFGSLNFVLAKGEMRRVKESADQIEKLGREVEKLKP